MDKSVAWTDEVINKIREKRGRVKIDLFFIHLIYAHIPALANQPEEPAVSSASCVYVNTGLRKSELRPENHTLEGDGSFLRLVGKGNKERIVPMPPEILEHYHNFIELDVTVDFVSKRFTSARKKAGINDSAKSLHALRHTTTYRLVKSGMSLTDLRDILGHSTVQMTEHYARVGIEYLNAELKDESAYVWDVRPSAYA